MTLRSGSRIGPYEIVSVLGAGGMGEVYRARDTKLNRDVAIKVLPDAFARDPERLARFTREAQTLASLNHPHIAQIYGIVDEPAGSHIVMELVEGEDLAQRLARGPLPVDEALPLARQMAEALEAAHERGVVHRDLKPANVKIAADGVLKVLDFGLAKAAGYGPDAAPAAAAADVANSPTFTSPAMTQMGVILGTAAYMSPEQARGKAVDKRADIWAFGVVLYEMLTGRRLFEGDGPSEMIAAVLRQDIDLAPLPAATPSRVRRLLARCLERDPKLRLRDIGEARIELATLDRVEPGPATPRRDLARMLWPGIAALMTIVALGSVAWFGRAARGPVPVTRLSVLPPPGATLYPDSASVAISPDGRMVAFVVGKPVDPETQLWVRSLDSSTARRIDGADGAILPFWSPDSTRLGFFTRTKMASVPAAGGRIDVICDVSAGRGAVWTPSDMILFARDVGGPLYTIPAAGGTAAAVTTLDASRKESSHRFPTLLPDGDHFLYAALPARDGKFEIYAASLSAPGRTLIGSFDSAVSYADPGWLLYLRNGVLVAHPFDTATRTLAGSPVPLDDEPGHILDPQTAYTAARPTVPAANGSLAYYAAPSKNAVAQWYDINGKAGAMIDLPAGHFDGVKISPDGRHAVLVRSASAAESALWLADLTNGGASPLAALPGRNDSPVWSPDGADVAFTANGSGVSDVFVKHVGDSSPPRALYHSDVLFKNPSAWSPDGRWIAMAQIDPGTAQNIWLLPASGGSLTPYFSSPRRDIAMQVSPDNRWLAYISDETGRFQLYVQSFPVPGQLVQVSSASIGAYAAWWSHDGMQLLFLGADRATLWRVPVRSDAAFTAGAPVLVARLPQDTIAGDVAPDGQRFLVLLPERSGTGSITVVQNWPSAVTKH
jgi:Tol biopolymer transport system component